MNVFVILIILTFSTISAHSSPDPRISDMQPETLNETFISSSIDAASNWQSLGGHNSMLPYVTSSPDQLSAGSCLYMALTGIAEWWLAKQNPNMSRRAEGPLDLSERYFMNLAGLEESQNGVDNWKTDTILLLNTKQRAALNRDFRFTKGWHKTNEDGQYVKATPNTPKAQYGTSFNWIKPSHFNQVPLKAKLPKFGRDVLFADPESNQWNVGIAPLDLAETIRNYLDTHESPVLLVYNHAGYWHAVGVYGYDRETPTECAFVEYSLSYFERRPHELRLEARKTTDPKKKESLLKLASKLEDTGLKAKQSYQRLGGCQQKGVFYVRDSIYSDSSEALYDYDLSRTGEEKNYSKRIVLRSEAFIQVLVNHAVGIYAYP